QSAPLTLTHSFPTRRSSDLHPLDVVIQRVKRRRGQNARLAHAAAEHLAEAVAAFDERLCPGDDRSDRRAQALREAHRNRIDVPRSEERRVGKEWRCAWEREH